MVRLGYSFGLGQVVIGGDLGLVARDGLFQAGHRFREPAAFPQAVAEQTPGLAAVRVIGQEAAQHRLGAAQVFCLDEQLDLVQPAEGGFG